MSKVYFTSDLHFGHSNLCKGLRGMTAEESDNLIISNWNKVVKTDDKVFILGDITMENNNHLYNLKLLNGNKVVIAGNHDTTKCCKYINELGIPTIGCLHYKGFICTHIPVHPSELERFNGNLHGHIHLSGDIDGLGYYEGIETGEGHFNVNTEFHNYTPIAFEEILSRISKSKI